MITITQELLDALIKDAGEYQIVLSGYTLSQLTIKAPSVILKDCDVYNCDVIANDLTLSSSYVSGGTLSANRAQSNVSRFLAATFKAVHQLDITNCILADVRIVDSPMLIWYLTTSVVSVYTGNTKVMGGSFHHSTIRSQDKLDISHVAVYNTTIQAPQVQTFTFGNFCVLFTRLHIHIGCQVATYDEWLKMTPAIASTRFGDEAGEFCRRYKLAIMELYDRFRMYDPTTLEDLY